MLPMLSETAFNDSDILVFGEVDGDGSRQTGSSSFSSLIISCKNLPTVSTGSCVFILSEFVLLDECMHFWKKLIQKTNALMVHGSPD